MHIGPVYIAMDHLITFFIEHRSSAVEYRTRNRESPGSNTPFATVSKFGHFHSLSCTNEYLAIDSGGNVSE